MQRISCTDLYPDGFISVQKTEKNWWLFFLCQSKLLTLDHCEHTGAENDSCLVIKIHCFYSCVTWSSNPFFASGKISLLPPIWDYQ